MNEISSTVALDGDTRRCCNDPECGNNWPCALHSGVTGNEGKDAPIGPDNTDALAKAPLNPAPLASPAVVTPEPDWADWKRIFLQCLAKYPWMSPFNDVMLAPIADAMEAYAETKVSELEAQLQQARFVIDNKQGIIDELERMREGGKS